MTRPLPAITLVALISGLALLSAATATELLRPWQAVVLGVVEGVTEYLPVSSTGHLLVVGDLMGLGTVSDREALETYVIAIQLGAIAAVVALYRARLAQAARGLAGKDDAGRRIVVALLLGFLPAAVLGVALGDQIKAWLFSPLAVAAAWAAGGFVLLLWQPSRAGRVGLDAITRRQAGIIGIAQAAALWPGTSRSLVTIVAALVVGLTMEAAVEYSFLLGLVTLSAATVWDVSRSGGELVATYGWATPLLGAAVAFVSAVAAVRWLVAYVRSHPLRIFGWYRIGVAVVVLGLMAAGLL